MMIITVYFGILVPMIFLLLVIKGEYRRLLLFFTWGLTSSILVYVLDFLRQYFLKINDSTLLLTQIIPPLEELIKSMPLILLLLKKKKMPRYSITRLAMAIGIGFSIIENYLYLSMMNLSDLKTSLLFIITRSITVCVLHGSLTALIGLTIQIMQDYGFISISLLAGSYIFSSTIHSIYNLVGLSDSMNFLGILIPPALFLAEFYLFNMFGRKNITRLSDIP